MKNTIIYIFFSLILVSNPCKLEKLDTPLDEGAQYGWVVDMSGDFMVVGGPGYYFLGDDEKYRCGTVLIFKKQPNGDYIFFQRLLPPDPSIQGGFGSSLAIHKEDLIVGDSQDKLNPNSIGGSDRAGAVYTYRYDKKENRWRYQNKIVKKDRDMNDHFGSQIALNDSFGIVTTSGYRCGELFVLKKNSSKEWEIKSRFNNGLTSVGHIDLDSNNLIFASDIDLKNEQPTTRTWKVVTASIDSEGQFSNFELVESLHDFKHRIFGKNDLKISGKYCFVNSYFKLENGDRLSNRGNIHFFKKDSSTGNWNEIQKIVSPDFNKVDFFGSSMAFDSNYLVVGAMGDNFNENSELIEYKGAAYVFQLKSDSLIFKTKINGPEKAWNKFGFSVAINNGYALIGSRLESYGDSVLNAGGAYVYCIKN